MRFRFGKEDRILKRSEFLALDGRGRRFVAEWFVVIVAPSAASRSRLGVTVSRRVGRAVQRNRIKRVVREFFRLNRHRLGGCWDLHVIARRGAAGQPNPALFESLRTLFDEIAKTA